MAAFVSCQSEISVFYSFTEGIYGRQKLFSVDLFLANQANWQSWTKVRITAPATSLNLCLEDRVLSPKDEDQVVLSLKDEGQVVLSPKDEGVMVATTLFLWLVVEITGSLNS